MNETKYSVLNNTKFIFRESSKIEKSIIPLMIIHAVPATVNSLMSAILLKILLSVIETGGELTALFISIGVFVLLSIAANFSVNLINTVFNIRVAKVRYTFQNNILTHSMKIPYESIENRENRKLLEKAGWFIGGGYASVDRILYVYKKLFNEILGVFSACALFSVVDSKISVLLLIVGVLTFILYGRLADVEKPYRDEKLLFDMKSAYFTLKKPTEIKAAKDIRIFGISSWFSPMMDILIGDRAKLTEIMMKRYTKYTLIEAFLVLVREGSTMYFLISSVLNGSISVSDFAFYFGVLNAFTLWISGIANEYQEIKKVSLVCSDYRNFFTLETMDEKETGEEINFTEPLSVEFKNVSFSYDKKKNVIDNVSFTVKPGEKIAIVGENGAGKTTCMKLLSGLYSPDSGEILINNINSADIPIKRYFALFSALFQDAFSIPASIGENVVLSENIDRDRLTSSLQKSGLYSKIESLENGADTLLDKELNKGGIDLSGGEMQKLFLARALYKDAPIIILDEPTAALDPIAENELYEKFSALTSGKTSFYISHRLSSTRFCDRILYLKDGKITETGTHDELMAQKRDYFRMYEMQSYYYKEEQNNEV